ncbi:60S ribosomal protein L7-4 [Sesamum angolense]|uniref:60S ribosomal protein L7-4 n=1 Tax=Sesamum angolense TaxID=2727404 RepID=A0AAE1WEU0_9LAMI|nr:60S ribosomal protein L7-4 [Sesamum angolense]
MGEEVKGSVIVPESVLKKQKRAEEWALVKSKEVEVAKKQKVETRKLICQKARQYAKEYEEQEKELIHLKREARLKGGFYVNPEAKLLFIIRSVELMPCTRTKKILQLLRLRQVDYELFLRRLSVSYFVFYLNLWLPMTGVGEAWNNLHGRSYSRDHDCWTPLQGSEQLLMAIPLKAPLGIEEEEESLRRSVISFSIHGLYTLETPIQFCSNVENLPSVFSLVFHPLPEAPSGFFYCFLVAFWCEICVFRLQLHTIITIPDDMAIIKTLPILLMIIVSALFLGGKNVEGQGRCCREWPSLGDCRAGIDDSPDKDGKCWVYCVNDCTRGGVCKFRGGKNVCHCYC